MRRDVSNTMRLIFDTVLQQVAVQMLQMVFGEADIGPRLKNHLHDLGIFGDFFLVAAGEFFDLKIGKQFLHLAIGQLAALTRVDEPTLSIVAMRRNPLSRSGAEGKPSAFSKRREQFRRDLNGVGIEHTRLIHLKTYPIIPDYS
jgi:hypothetical protein